MNNIFVKNLTALTNKNPELVAKLQAYIPSEIPKLVQENGMYNIFYKDRLIHNPVNPLAEANQIFQMAENIPVSIHIVFGVGLGYLFQVTSLNSKGTVILYEPDFNLLWLAFTLVDFSNDILKDNVFVVSELNEVDDIIYKKSGIENSPQMLSLPSQRMFDAQGFDNVVKFIQDKIGSYALDLKYTQTKFYSDLVMLVQNIPNLTNEIPLVKLKDFYKGKTAVVVSAGPTLDRNIETLKKHRDKYVLFTVGTALKTLVKNDITPDFLCIIETYNSSRQVEGVDLSNVNFITEPYSNPALRNFKYKNIYSHISANSPINHFWAEVCGENIEEYWSKGTVSYTALNSARLLGCSKIILVGQDLAYIEGQCYSKESAYKDLRCEFDKNTKQWQIVAKDFESFARAISPSDNPDERAEVANRRLSNLNSSLYYVKGIQGYDIPTESVYAAFVRPLSQYVEHFNDRRYINTSLVGAQIDGFDNVSLEEALKDSEVVGLKDVNSDFKYNKIDVINNLRVKLDELKLSIPKLENGVRLIRNIKNEMKRARSLDVEVLKTLKVLSLNYLELSSEFANKSKLFDFIITSDKIDLDYEMKMMENFSYESVLNITNKLEHFHNNALQKIKDIEGLINESINSAS